jgi:hypothetical protein
MLEPGSAVVGDAVDFVFTVVAVRLSARWHAANDRPADSPGISATPGDGGPSL